MNLRKWFTVFFTSYHVFYRTRRRNWDLSFSLSTLSCNFNNYTSKILAIYVYYLASLSLVGVTISAKSYLYTKTFGKFQVMDLLACIYYTPTNLIASLSFLSPMLSMSRMLYSLLAAARASFAFRFSSRSCSLRFRLDSFFFFLVKYWT